MPPDDRRRGANEEAPGAPLTPRSREVSRRRRARSSRGEPRHGRSFAGWRIAVTGLLAIAALIAIFLPRSAHPGSSSAGATVVRTTLSVGESTLGALPSAVQDAAVAPLGGKRVALLGGLDAAQSSTTAINVLSGASVSASGSLPRAQHDAQAAALDGAVYVFGGGEVSSFNHILRYDPATGTVGEAGVLPSAASDVAVAAIGNTAYVVGGYDGVHPLDTILAWRPGSSPQTVAHLPFGVRYAAVAAVGGRLIIAGGTTEGGVSDQIFSFDPASGSLTRIGRLPVGLTHASAAQNGGRVYLVGGREQISGGQSAAILAIDPANGSVSRAGSLPEPLSDAAVVALGERLLVLGGEAPSGTRSTVLALTPHVSRVVVHLPSPAAVAKAALAALSARGFATALHAHPQSIRPYEGAANRPGLPGYLLVADRGNNRILVLNPQREIVWQYPTASDLAAGRRLHFNDDTFVEPGGEALIANEEDNDAIVSIGIATHKLEYLFGHPGVVGGGRELLNYPDDAYMLADGSFTVADAYNCRILFVRAHAIVREYGASGVCRHEPPRHFGAVNGDTPTPEGGILVSEIPGHWVDSIAANGTLQFSVQAPVAYPSDPQPLPGGRVLLADYSGPGHVVVMNSSGRVLWRYGPSEGAAMLNHPSLAFELPNGDIAVNDDYRDRVVIIDPHTRRIVWQYGHTDTPGTAPGYLNTPDGMDFIPAGPHGEPDWAATVHP